MSEEGIYQQLEICQSQRDAAREELAKQGDDYCKRIDEVINLQQRLADAERRNVQDLRQAYELGYIDGGRTPDEIRSDKEIREERLKYMLVRAKPTESGASE
jgi:hypothetical protein